MPKLEQGELFTRPKDPGIIVVTANNTIKQDGCLVMGAGAALDASVRIPALPKEAGEQILMLHGRTEDYGFIVVREPVGVKTGIALLQTKRYFNDPSKLTLVGFSLYKLMLHAWEHPGWNYRLNFPGIGYGKLDRATVLPLLMDLPENITIVERPYVDNV